jgi:hypothetical protein
MANDRLVRLGKVSNDYSNFLSVLIVDAGHVGAWGGPSNGGLDDDFARANEAADDGRYNIDVGEGHGIVAEVGGCGIGYLHRIGDVLVMAEHYRAHDRDDAEPALIAGIMSIPTTDAEPLGTVRSDTGVLAFVAMVEPGQEPDGATLAGVRSNGALVTEYGLLVAVPPGDYDVWCEDFDDVRGDWGLICGRLRVVPTRTPVIEGAPIA